MKYWLLNDHNLPQDNLVQNAEITHLKEDSQVKNKTS